MDGFAIIPQAPHSGGFVELSRSRTGRLFEKHILNFGTLLYPAAPGGKVTIDQKWADALVANFKNGVCPIVQVPVAGANNEHTEDPNRNIGEVVGLSVRNRKIYAQIDVRDEAAAKKVGKTLLGASAMLHLNYTDTRTGKRVGPSLLHVAVTNRPYVVDLDDFSEILAASAPGAADGNYETVVLTAPTTEDKMDLDDLKAELKADHGIDVDALQRQSGLVDSAVALTNAVRDALTENDLLTLSNSEDVTADALVSAIKEAGDKIVALSGKVEEIEKASAQKDAVAHVDDLIRAGRILPKHKDAQVELLLSNPTLFDSLLPEQPLVRLSHEDGTDPIDPKPSDDVKAEIERIASTPAASQYIH